MAPRTRTRRLPAFGTLLVSFLALWWTLDLWANPPPPAPSAEAQAKFGLKVFKLSFTDPSEMRVLLGQVLETLPPAPQQTAFLGGGINAFMGGAGVIGGQALGNIGGGPTPVHMAVARRVQTLIVRAPERDLKVCADVVAVLDTAPGKPLPKVKNIGVFALKHAQPEPAQALLQELGFQVVAVHPLKLLITTDVPALEDVAAVIREIDVPERPAPPADKRKKLLDEPPPKE